MTEGKRILTSKFLGNQKYETKIDGIDLPYVVGIKPREYKYGDLLEVDVTFLVSKLEIEEYKIGLD